MHDMPETGDVVEHRRQPVGKTGFVLRTDPDNARVLVGWQAGPTWEAIADLQIVDNPFGHAE